MARPESSKGAAGGEKTTAFAKPQTEPRCHLDKSAGGTDVVPSAKSIGLGTTQLGGSGEPTGLVNGVAPLAHERTQSEMASPELLSTTTTRTLTSQESNKLSRHSAIISAEL